MTFPVIPWVWVDLPATRAPERKRARAGPAFPDVGGCRDGRRIPRPDAKTTDSRHIWNFAQRPINRFGEIAAGVHFW